MPEENASAQASMGLPWFAVSDGEWVPARVIPA